MDATELRRTTKDPRPPSGLRPTLLALWHEARGEWDRAHELAQDVEDAEGSWIHAYLHRREGDRANAEYWYRRAGKPWPHGTLDEEWARIADELLRRDGALSRRGGSSGPATD